MSLRQTPDALYIVASAGGPLGGDDVAIDIDVEAGATLRMRSAAATLAQPGPHATPSRTALRAQVAAGARLELTPAPLVSVRGSDHLVDTCITLKGTARLLLEEAVVLGRAGEQPGRLRVRTRIERDEVPVFVHELDLGGDDAVWRSAAVIGDARAIITTLLVGQSCVRTAEVVTRDGGRAAWLPLADDAALVVALGPNLTVARSCSAAFWRVADLIQSVATDAAATTSSTCMP